MTGSSIRTTAAIGIALAGASAAVLAALALPAAAAGTPPSFAYGIQAEGADPLVLQPYLTWTIGPPLNVSSPGASTSDALISAGPMSVSVAAGTAAAHVQHFAFVDTVVTATVLTTCLDGTGTVTLTGTADGTALPTSPTPGQKISLGPNGYVQLDQQSHPQSDLLKVIGLQVYWHEPGASPETVTVAAVSCATSGAAIPPTTTPTTGSTSPTPSPTCTCTPPTTTSSSPSTTSTATSPTTGSTPPYTTTPPSTTSTSAEPVTVPSAPAPGSVVTTHAATTG
jgi:hypothetical protein